MASTERLTDLLAAADAGVRALQTGADTLRSIGIVAQAALLEHVATTLARTAYDVRQEPASPERLATFMAACGRSVRAMQFPTDTIRTAGLTGQTKQLEHAASDLAHALHDASQDTIPIHIVKLDDTLE